MRLAPRDTRFYDLFTAASRHVLDAATLLARLVDSPPDQRPAVAAQLRDVEHAGDEATHDIMRAVNTSFITPFDRDDIALLASRLDDVIDEMEEAGDLTVLYRLGELPDGIRHQVALLTEAADLTAEAMPRLRTLQDLDTFWIGVNDVENRADTVYRSLLVQLFDSGGDVVTMIKTKEVVDRLEEAADAFERLANVVQSIAAKES
jgi:predicted phosphate transport protein (TIGR00153 family)